MIHALLSIDPDLGSSIAVRYAERLSELTGLSLQSVHVVQPKSKGPEPGTGWVRKTWEKALLESDREEIRRLLELENAARPLFSVPKLLLGDRQEEILGELQEGRYDLFMEGALPAFDLSDFQALVRSRLYRSMPCPALVVKNLVTPQKAALVLSGDAAPASFLGFFLRMFDKPVMETDVVYCRFTRGGEPVWKEAGDSVPELTEAQKMLADHGWSPGTCRLVEGAPEDIAEQLRNYGLVASALERNPGRKSPMVELLGRVLCPVLLCWK